MESGIDPTLHETTLLTCWFGEDGILYSKSKNATRSIKNYEELFELYRKLSNDGSNKLCTLGDISRSEPLSKEVREFITIELPKYIKAMALVSNTTMGKAIGTIFTQLSSSPYPTATFETKEEAVEWLKQYL